jgi:hypothetical protein
VQCAASVGGSSRLPALPGPAGTMLPDVPCTAAQTAGKKNKQSHVSSRINTFEGSSSANST